VSRCRFLEMACAVGLSKAMHRAIDPPNAHLGPVQHIRCVQAALRWFGLKKAYPIFPLLTSFIFKIGYNIKYQDRSGGGRVGFSSRPNLLSRHQLIPNYLRQTPEYGPFFSAQEALYLSTEAVPPAIPWR
jgi:hypothetical protein